MTLCEDVNNQFHSKTNGKADKVIKLLEAQADIIEMNQQRDGEGLYIKFSPGGYFNFGDISTTLFNECDLCIHGFDQDSNGERNVWLVTKNYIATH